MGQALWLKFSTLPRRQKAILLGLALTNLSILTILILSIVQANRPTPPPTLLSPVALATAEVSSEVTSATPTLTSMPLPIATATHTPLVSTPALPASIAPLWTPAPVPPDAELEQFIAGMTLEDKVAQMLMVGFQGLSVESSPELPVMVGRYHVGGVVLLEANAHNPQQLSTLTSQLQTLARSSGVGIPLFISLNHEGGIVVRITQGVTEFPGNMAIAATDNPDNAYIAAALAAQELRAMGLNMNLAPVLDINDEPLNPVIGVRSFGAAPDLVTEYGRLTVEGLQDYGIISVAKHFPGHGSVAADSHIALPVLSGSVRFLQTRELLPFAAAIEADVAAIMTAHILVPEMDVLPATFSPAILNGLLREQMGYDGLIMTDSLGMAGASAGRSQAEAAVLAVKAGADILLSTAPMSAHIAIWESVVAAVRSGEIPESQIDRSVLRILRVKYAYGLFDTTQPAGPNVVGTAELAAVAERLAQESVTLVRAGVSELPLSGTRLLLISPDQLPFTASGNSLLAETLQAQGYEVRELVFNVANQDSRSAVYANALALASNYDQIVFGEWELVKRRINVGDVWQENLIAALYARNPQLIVVAWHNPAASLLCPEGATVLTAYGNTPGQVKAIAAALAGDISPTGVLPLSLFLDEEVP